MLEVSSTNTIDTLQFTATETLPYFESREVGTPQVVNLDRVLFPSGEALSPFSLNLDSIGEIQPFMDFAVGADVEVVARFQFRDAGAQVAFTQQDVSGIYPSYSPVVSLSV